MDWLASSNHHHDAPQKTCSSTEETNANQLVNIFAVVALGGWGYMPEPMVREDVEAGRLVRLDMREYKDGFLRLHIGWTHRPPGRLLAHCPVRGAGGRGGRSH
jgi:DNA-binding transcriptional LysR family regulator